MSRGTAGVPEGVLLESNGISRDLTPSGLKRTAAPALKGRRSDEICQDLTDCRRDHNPRVGGSSPSSATKLHLHNQPLTPYYCRACAALADWANSITNRPALRSWRNRCRNSSSTSSSSSTTRIRTLTRAPPLCGRPRPTQVLLNLVGN